MEINRADLRIETMRGTGPGGQHRNKTDSAVRVTHIPTGVTAYADERSQKHSRRKAMSDLEEKLEQMVFDRRAAERKARRDEAIKPQANLRTYNFLRGTVKDHRSGKVASIKDVLGKGRIDLLHPDVEIP